MYRKTLAVLLVLLLLVVAGAVTVAQDVKQPNKQIGPMFYAGSICWEKPCGTAYYRGTLSWGVPEKTPDSYRVSWAVDGKWRSWKKPNTKKRGNAFVPGAERRYRLPGVKVAPGETLYVRVRARYKGEKNGPWGPVLKLTND